MTGRRRVFERVAAFLAALLCVWGCVLLADWLRAREAPPATAWTEATARPGGPPPAPEDEVRMRAFLSGRVAYGPARALSFGKDRALFAAGPSHAPPEVVLEELAERARSAWSEGARRGAVAAGPSAQVAFRTMCVVAKTEGVASLVSMPPDMAAIRKGGLRLEPGGVVLVYPVGAHWEYVTFYFPDGLDLQAYIESHGVSKDALAPLGPAADRHLEPTLALGTGGAGPRTVFCRARGRAGIAMDGTVDDMVRTGWRRVHRGAEPGGADQYVLAGPAGQEVWITTDDRERKGGLVTVLIAAS